MYRFFNITYNSPTVGLYFFSDDYIKFLKRLKYYLSLELKFISAEESKYRDILEKRKETNVPIGLLDDVEIVFLHYKSQEEAYEKWNRRKERVNFDNLIIKFSEMNLCSIANLREFDKLPYRNKLVFTTKDYGLKSQIIFKEYLDCEEVKNDTTYFNKYISILKLCQGEIKAGKQVFWI